MGFTIKNNFGTLVDNHDRGIVIASTDEALKIAQRVKDAMGTDNIEDADFEDITEEQAEALKATCGNANNNDQAERAQEVEFPEAVLAAPEKTFTQNSDFVKNKVANAVMKYYQGSPTNLAYIVVVACDWGLLKARKHTLDFVRSCFAIGAIPYVSEADIERINDTVKRQLNGQTRNEGGIKYKVPGLPPDYKTWTGKLADMIPFCNDIAKEFEGPGMFNSFEKRREQEASR